MRTLLTALAICTLTVTANGQTASKVSPGTEKGPHPVGVRTMVLVDGSRRDEYANGPRTLVTEIWYPATSKARKGDTTNFGDFFGEYQAEAGQVAAHFGSTLEEINKRYTSIGVRDAPLQRGKYPLLVFSHGNGGLRHQNVFQVDHLASHGYVIVSADHTGNAAVTPLPDKALPYDRGGRGRSAKNRPLDASFLISHFLAASKSSRGWLRGSLDPEKIGVLGHSFGGFTACSVAASDSRVKAILPMTVAYGKSPTIPLLLMLGAWDRTIGAPGNRVSGTYYQRADGPKHMLVIKRGGHFTFSDMDRINPKFGDGIGKDKKSGEDFLPIDRAKDIINTYSLAFFDHYLKGDQDAAKILATNLAPDELSLESEIPK